MFDRCITQFLVSVTKEADFMINIKHLPNDTLEKFIRLWIIWIKIRIELQNKYENNLAQIVLSVIFYL